jgi:hypothetical protein
MTDCVLELQGTIFTSSFFVFGNLLMSRMTTATGLDASGTANSMGISGTLSVGIGVKLWTPPIGARNGLTTGLNIRANSFASCSDSFSVHFSSISATSSVTLNGLHVDAFATDIEGRCAIFNALLGGRNYLRDITGDPATLPIGGCYIYSVGGQVRLMNPAGVITNLN